jgi:Na+/melibiose symporter-like transporter
VTSDVAPLGRRHLLGYAAGSFATGVFSAVPTVLLLYFSTETLKLPASWAAMVILLPKLWGILWDPLVGNWSDRTASAMGRRRPFLVAGGIGVALSFILLFSPPALAPVPLFAWTFVAYSALTSSYSLFAVPYIAVPAQIGQDRETRARLVAWRMSAAMIGVLAGAGVAPLIVDAAGGGRPGYAVMAIVLAATCGIAMAMPVAMLAGRDTPAPRISGRPATSLRQFVEALSHRDFRRLTLTYVILLTAIGIMSSALPYCVTRVLGRAEGDIGIALMVMLGATTLAVGLWAVMTRRLGDLPVLRIAILLFAAASAGFGASLCAGLPWPAILAGLAVIGTAIAGLQLVPFTLAAHMIHAHHRPGSSMEGVFTGIWTASEKLGLALGPSLTALALGADASGLVLFIAIMPAALALGVIPLLIPPRASRAISEPRL